MEARETTVEETEQADNEVPAEGYGGIPAWLIAMYIGLACWVIYYVFVIGLVPPPEWR